MAKGMLKQVSLLLPVPLLVVSLACGQALTPTLDVYDVEHNLEGTGTVFIWAVANGDEQLAMSVLSARNKLAVAEYCNGGKVIACFNNAGLQDWRGSQVIVFLPDYSHGSTATYSAHWTNDNGATFIVLKEVKENDEWRVDSWRGLISSLNGIPSTLSGLVDGTDTTNLFPPEP